jgi:metal-responsive CopG/Arc/MetJ family transcriptional regulator
MKAIQITIDERLLVRLDADEEVKRDGRSAVLRRAVADYLRKKRRGAVADAYRRGYGKHPSDVDLAGWTDEGVWPEE